MAASRRKHEALHRHYDTIVIGAGISGLACAARLYEQPKYQQEGKLLVLEARDRIGGRINSVHVNGCRLDTGANWIHGIGTDKRRNPLMDILPNKRCKELRGMVAFRPPPQNKSSDRSNDKVDDDGWVHVGLPRTQSPHTTDAASSPVIPAKVTGKMYSALWDMIDKLHEFASSLSPQRAKKMRLAAAIQETNIIRDVLKELPEEYHTAFRSMPAFIETMEAGPLILQSLEDNSNPLGVLEFASDDFDGEQVFLQDGYLDVVNEIAKDLVRDGRIHTGVTVQKIDWSGNPIRIKTKPTTYTANRVVCTLPLGVLQHGALSYHPQLPKERLSALNNLGFGTLDKIFLTYKSPWWEQDPFLSILQPGVAIRPVMPRQPSSSASFSQIPDSMMGFTYDLPGIQLDSDGLFHHGPRLLSVINLHSISGQPALCAFVSGRNAIDLESQTDDAVADLLHRTLQSWFQRSDIPRPDGVHVTRWNQDPFARGSYSYMCASTSTKEHRDLLAEPLVNKAGAELRFAGEHTSREHFATVHGALLSGWREAERILES